MIQLGGDKAWRIRKFGDIVVAFHWVNGEPAMCLYPKIPRTLGNRGAAIICLSAIHKYVKSNGDPEPSYLIPKAIEAARVMGMDETKFTVKRIADAILECVEDLVKMPPEPDSLQGPQGKQVGEMSLMVNGHVIHEEAVNAVTVEELQRKHSYGD
jgi:hypothetical protein